MIFEVFKSDIYSDGTIETEGMGTTDTFEISQQSPFNGGFSIASDQTQVLQVEQPLSLLPKPLLVKLSLSQSLRRQ